MTNDRDKMIREYLAEIGRKGGNERAKRHGKAQLREWAKLGGRPKGSSKKKPNRKGDL